MMIVLCTVIAISYQAASIWVERRRRHEPASRKAAGIGTVAWLLLTATLSTTGYTLAPQINILAWLCIAELVAFPAGIVIQQFAAREMRHPDAGPPTPPSHQQNEPDEGQSKTRPDRPIELNENQFPPPERNTKSDDRQAPSSPDRQTEQKASVPALETEPWPVLLCGVHVVVPRSRRCRHRTPFALCGHAHYR